MSLLVALPADEFVSPGVRDFWWPIIPFHSDSPWALTRPALVMLLSVAVLSWVYLAGTKNLKLVPSKGQFLLEQSYDFVRNTIARDVIGAKNFKPFLPLLFTLFTLIFLNNFAGFIPFIQFPSTSRIGIPIVLTLIVYLVYHVAAVRHKGGFGKYLGSLTPPGLPGWLVPIMWVLEFLTYFFIRPLTLALRLFGNMMAGHLMLLVFIVGGQYLLLHVDNFGIKGAGVLSLLFAVVMSFFELLIQFLQAFIFTLLAALYIADAVSDGH